MLYNKMFIISFLRINSSKNAKHVDCYNKTLWFSENIPTRSWIAVMIFVNSVYYLLIRGIISINLVAMVNVNPNVTSEHDFDWTANERGLILSSYFWGCLAGNFIAGPLLELVSIRKMMSASLVGLGGLTLLSPVVAYQGVVYMIILRIFIGLITGIFYAGHNSIISKWSTPSEKGMFVGAIVLGSTGTFISWSVGGYIVDAFGWQWGFYAPGILGPFIACLCWFALYDTPEEHPRISDEEKKYLQNEIARNRGPKRTPPLRRIYTSIPVWSAIALNFGLGWGVHFLQTSAPNYIANTLGFSITSTGLLSAFIYLFRSLLGFIAGTITDIMLKKDLISVNVLRNVGVFMSHVLPGCGLLFMLKMGLPMMAYVLIIGVSTAFNGMVTLACHVNPHDLTANFVSTVSSLVYTANLTAGIVTPIVTAHLTKKDETNVEEWRSVFVVGASVYLISGLQFYLFGSIKKQPWDQIENIEEEKDDAEKSF